MHVHLQVFMHASGNHLSTRHIKLKLPTAALAVRHEPSTRVLALPVRASEPAAAAPSTSQHTGNYAVIFCAFGQDFQTLQGKEEKRLLCSMYLHVRMMGWNLLMILPS